MDGLSSNGPKLGSSATGKLKFSHIDSCVFCGSSIRLTYEDVIPKWVGQLFLTEFQSKGVLFKRRDLGASSPPEVRPRKYGSASMAKFCVVCASCNNNWMSVIENRNKARLTGLILGRARKIDTPELEEMALWFTLKALMFDLVTEADPCFERGDFELVYRTKRPHPGMQLWVGCYDGDPNEFVQFHVSPVHGVNIDSASLHSTKLFLRIGKMASDVTITPLRNIDMPPFHGRPSTNYFEQFWPPKGSFEWPPLVSMDATRYEYFSRPDLHPPVARPLSEYKGDSTEP